MQFIKGFNYGLVPVTDAFLHFVLAFQNGFNSCIHSACHQLLHLLERYNVNSIHLRHCGRIIRPLCFVHHRVPDLFTQCLCL